MPVIQREQPARLRAGDARRAMGRRLVVNLPDMERLTPRLLLREFREDDWTALLAYQNHPLLSRYYPWTERPAAIVQTNVRRYVEFQAEQPRTRFQLAVVLRETGQLIGKCGMLLEKPGSPEAEMNYELDPEFWGKGYATEAAGEVLALGFAELDLHRISAKCVAENTASARVLEKLGMRLEGHLREKEYYRARWWDVLLYAILRQEWTEAGSGPALG